MEVLHSLLCGKINPLGQIPHTEKYRDDVECDKTRKERLNLENIIFG